MHHDKQCSSLHDRWCFRYDEQCSSLHAERLIHIVISIIDSLCRLCGEDTGNVKLGLGRWLLSGSVPWVAYTMHFLGQLSRRDTQLLCSWLRKFAQAASYGPSLNLVNYTLAAAKESLIYSILLLHFTKHMIHLNLYKLLGIVFSLYSL